MAARPTGTLTKKTSRHDAQCTMSPPTVGPNSGPNSAGMMTKFIACSSSPLEKVRTMTMRPTGIIMAAAMPCGTRAAISMVALTASPQSTEDTVNRPTANMKMRRLP